MKVGTCRIIVCRAEHRDTYVRPSFNNMADWDKIQLETKYTSTCAADGRYGHPQRKTAWKEHDETNTHINNVSLKNNYG